MPTMTFQKQLAAGETIESVFIGQPWYVLARPALLEIAAVATAEGAPGAADLATFSVTVGGALFQQSGPVQNKVGATTPTPQHPWDFLIKDFGQQQSPVVVAVKNAGGDTVTVNIVCLITWT